MVVYATRPNEFSSVSEEPHLHLETPGDTHRQTLELVHFHLPWVCELPVNYLFEFICF
jgi:hypothetical protein